MTIVAISDQLRNRELSPVELTRECLSRIERINPVLNAFITVTGDSALAEARRAEQEIRSGKWRGPLHGIPIALKDLIDTAGVRTTAASALFLNRVPNRDADVVRRLREAGAVFLGKNNLHEFAYGGSSMISHFGPARNPWNPERITGGSSGGSAAAVAAELCYAAIGTDTAGSIREPAAYCGVVGLKPTYGLVSAEGVVPLSWSLDHVGPLTSSVADAAVVLQMISQDSTREYLSALEQNPAELLVGVPEDSSLRTSIPKSLLLSRVRLPPSARWSKLRWILKSGSIRIGLCNWPNRTSITAAGSRARPTCTSLRPCAEFVREKRLLQNSANEAERNLRQSANESSRYFRMWTRSSHPPCH